MEINSNIIKPLLYCFFCFWLIICLNSCLARKNKCGNNAPPLFIKSEIQDSLETFLACFDTFPNRINYPTVTNIDFREQGSDTLISFSTSFGEQIDPPCIKYNKVRAFYYHNRPIIVKYYDSIRDMSHLIDESILSEEVYSTLKQELSDSFPYEDDPIYHSYWKVYKLSQDGLSLMDVGYPAIGKKRLLLKGETPNKEIEYYDPKDTIYY